MLDLKKGGEKIMKKGVLSGVILVCFVASVVLVSGLFAAPPETVTLKASFGNVTFPHKKHVETQKIDCTKCHHTWKAGETSGKPCVDCHKAKAEGKAPAAKDAFHKVCQDCHKTKKAGPTKCTECHKK